MNGGEQVLKSVSIYPSTDIFGTDTVLDLAKVLVKGRRTSQKRNLDSSKEDKKLAMREKV